MTQRKYLNGVLTIIAICLVLITMATIGVIPKASANPVGKYAAVPLNSDGSINVKLVTGSSTLKVDVESIEPSAFVYVEPLEVKIK